MHQRKNTNSHNNSTNMYSRGGSGGYGRGDVEGGGGRFNDANTNILEQQNNDRISELSEQVARLKVNYTLQRQPQRISTRGYLSLLI